MNQKNQIDSPKRGGLHNLLILHSLFAAICGSFIFISIFKTFAEGKSLFQTSLSGGRLFFLLAILLLVLFFYVTSFYLLLKPDQAQRLGTVFFEKPSLRSAGLRLSGIGFALCWIGYFVSPHLVFDGIQGYFLLIKPILLWGCLFFISQIVIIYLGSGGQLLASIFSSSNSLYRPALVILFLFFLVFILVVNTGIGVSVREDYWYGAGVPVLWIQIAFSLFVGITSSWLLNNNIQLVKRIPNIDAIVFVLLWIAAAYLWGKEPLQPSHFFPDTGLNEIYPYSDGALFDIGSQYALIGQGLFNGQYFDRSLYSALLTYFHTLAGQSTENLMVVQAVVFAVFPALLFLLCRELHSRTLGITLAILVIFRGINAIFGASMIDLAGPKMMLTDFPTAIGVSLVILFVLKWINNPQKIVYMVWAGCSIGLTLLLRTHVILLLPFIVALIMVLFKNRKILWVYGVVFLILGMLVSTLPLDIQNQKKGVPIFYIYYYRIQLVLKARYGLWEDANSRIPEKINANLLAGRQRAVLYRDGESTLCDSKYCAIANHFFHNLATSVLSLPTSFVWDDFRHTVKETAPYWKQDWIGGGLGFENYALLIINLTLLSIGAGVMWRKSRYGVLFLSMIYFAYMLSNSLAFTSGGRYITPVDWIVFVFYAMGALKFCDWFLCLIGIDYKPESDNTSTGYLSDIAPVISARNLMGAFVAVFMIGCVVPLTDSLFSQRYHEKTTADVLVNLNEKGLLAEANLTQAAVSEFLNSPGARLTYGRLLYPRFYPSDKGEHGLDYPYTALDYRRLVFMVIGPVSLGPDGVIFSVENLIPDLHADDVVVLGCANSNFLDAAIVFIISEPNKIFFRSTDLKLQCPLPRP